MPVLSVFEYVNRRSRMQRFFGKRSKVRQRINSRSFSHFLKALVDEQLATISSTAEHLLGVHLAHGELCKLPMLEDHGYSAGDFLRSLFVDLASTQGLILYAQSFEC